MTELASALDAYLTTRRSLGFKLKRPGALLNQFVAELDASGQTTITLEVALAWAMLPPGADPSWWGKRLAAIRGFAAWRSAFDPATEVPPKNLLSATSRRAEPYPYTDDDIAALMRAARSIPSPLRAATYETLIGLLAVSGMRVGEVIGLDRDDFNTDEGVAVVRATKFGTSREVALHDTTLAALADYEALRKQCLPRPRDSAFFLSLGGRRLIYNNVHFEFHRLVGVAGIEAQSERCRPRIHDLRHRFAVNTLVGWYRSGEDVGTRMYQLSTYLGHIVPEATYWYLRAAPELMGLAAQRLEDAQEPGR
jgi:integrase/recombinase XerD